MPTLEEIVVHGTRLPSREGWYNFVTGELGGRAGYGTGPITNYPGYPTNAPPSAQEPANDPRYIEEVVVKGKRTPRRISFRLTQRILWFLARYFRGPWSQILTPEEFVNLYAEEIARSNPVVDETDTAQFEPKEQKLEIEIDEGFVEVVGEPNKLKIKIQAEPLPEDYPDLTPPDIEPEAEPFTFPQLEPANDPEPPEDQPLPDEDWPPIFIPLPDVAPPEEQPELPEPANEPEYEPQPGEDPYENPSEEPQQDPQRNPEQAPEQAPQEEPASEPALDPETLPSLPDMKMELAVRQGRLEFIIQQMPAARPQHKWENRRRKDTKSKHNQLYRTVMKFITKTFGEVTEILDMIDAVFDNVEYRGKSLNRYSLKRRIEILKGIEEGRISLSSLKIDWEQMIVDIVAMNAMDTLVGKVAGKAAQARVSGNWYAPVQPGGSNALPSI